MNKKIKIILKAIITILLLLYIFLKIDWKLFYTNLKNINIIYIIIPALMAYISIYISILKWDIFLKNYGIVISKLKLYSIYSISTFFNNFFPTSFGGDFYKIIYLNKRNRDRKKEILSSIIQERGLGFLSLFLINFLILPFYFKLFLLNKNLLYIEIIIFLFIVFILFLIINYTFFIKIKNIFIKKDILIINKFQNLILSIVKIKNKKIIIYGLTYSIIFSIIIAIARYMLFYAFNININFYYILLVSSITQIIGILPISLNSLGVTEGLNIYLYKLVGIPIEISLAVVLIGRISLIITSSIGGLFYIFDKKIKY